MKPRHRYLSRRPIALVVALVVAVPALAVMVSERHYFEVPQEDENRLEARLDIALGSVELGLAEEGFLFQAEVRIESEKLRPYFHYKTEGRTGRLEVDLESKKGESSVNLSSLSAATSSEWILLFGDAVPIDLELKMGAAKGNLDFTGLPLERLKLDAGASRAFVHFDQPNPVVMEEFEISAGASQVELNGIGNARARRVRFGGGVGKYLLDFTGEEPERGARAYIEVGMAALTVIVPEGEPVVLYTPDNWLCSVQVPNGFTKRGSGIWFSEEVSDPDEAFRVTVEAGVGKITFAHL